MRSVIEEMHATQLAASAVFSEVKRFEPGMLVVLEGEVADSLYILLSGYWTVTTHGVVVGELSEGDVCSEIGLIAGGKRMTTIDVVSADAKVLYMSQQAFDALL